MQHKNPGIKIEGVGIVAQRKEKEEVILSLDCRGNLRREGVGVKEWRFEDVKRAEVEGGKEGSGDVTYLEGREVL